MLRYLDVWEVLFGYNVHTRSVESTAVDISCYIMLSTCYKLLCRRVAVDVVEPAHDIFMV